MKKGEGVVGEREPVGRIRESLRKEQVLQTFRGITRRSSECRDPQVGVMCLRKSQLTRRRVTQEEYRRRWAG